jgi:hypothetical protein
MVGGALKAKQDNKNAAVLLKIHVHLQVCSSTSR